MQLPFPGGPVALKVRSDGPTLVGANVSFSISLHFPESQKVLPDGQVIWSNDTIINGEYLYPKPSFLCPNSPVPLMSSGNAPFHL